MTEVTARWRAALVVALVGIVSLLVAASLASTVSAEHVIVVAALAATRALVGTRALLPVPGSRAYAVRPRRRAAAVPLVLAGRTTDVVHHPVRPRAPGLV